MKWFSVPEDQKVTEKQMLTAIIGTAFSILVCMACMAGSAWAWFAVDVEYGDNAISMGTFAPVISVMDANSMVLGQENDGGFALDAGSYTVTVYAENCQVGGYVRMWFTDGINKAVDKWVTPRLECGTELAEGERNKLTFTVQANELCYMHFQMGWGIPAQPNVADGDTVTFGTAATSGGEEEGSGNTEETAAAEESKETQSDETTAAAETTTATETSEAAETTAVTDAADGGDEIAPNQE